MTGKWVNYSFFLVFTLGLNQFALAQKKLYVNIQKNKKTYPEKDFTFVRVEDARRQFDNIGYIYKSDRNYQYLADFESGLPRTFLGFLNRTFPNNISINKILVRVKDFKLNHLITGAKLDSGQVYINVDFFRVQKDSLYFLYNYTNALIEASEEVAMSHGNRIKRAIILSVAGLERALAAPPQNNEFGKTREKLNKPLPDYMILNKQNTDSLNLPAYYFFFGGAHASLCSTDLMSGANVNLVFRVGKSKRYLIGPRFNIFIFGLYNVKSLGNNVGYGIFNYDLGLRLLKQVKGKTFLSFSPQLLLGEEKFVKQITTWTNGPIPRTSTETKTERFQGFSLDMGIYSFPPKETGLFYGLDLFIRDTSSLVFETNIGLKFNLGIKF